MTNTVAYEMITTRLSHYSASTLDRYDPVMINAAGKIAVADGTRPFVGVVQYGVDDEDQMVTFVRGIFPIIAGANISKGALLAVDTGAAVTAVTGKVVIGVALNAASAGELVSVCMVDQYTI